MSFYTLEIKDTKYKSILKFEANRFLVRFESYKFTSKNDAQISPLAEILLRLTYVKTVYLAENFIAIEVFDEFQWKDTQDEVFNLINDYLNSGKPIVNLDDESLKKKIPVNVYTEMGSGPGVLNFVTDRKLVLNPVLYDFNKEVKDSPLARALFKFDYVKRVNFDQNKIMITKGGSVQWYDVVDELREFIRDYIMNRQPVMDDSYVHPETKE